MITFNEHHIKINKIISTCYQNRYLHNLYFVDEIGIWHCLTNVASLLDFEQKKVEISFAGWVVVYQDSRTFIIFIFFGKPDGLLMCYLEFKI